MAGVESEKKVPQNLVSFKEESTRVADLSESEREGLEELKQLMQEINAMFMGVSKQRNYTQRLFQVRGEDEVDELLVSNETMAIL